MNISRIGIDLAKNVFQLHGVDRRGKVVWKRRLKCDQWLKAVMVHAEPGCEMGMEACGGAHHWARELEARGFTVKLIAPQFVKPYVKSNKNDANDAEAICEAMSRPNMRFVTIKSVAQQDIQATHRIRAELIEQRTAKANQISLRLLQLMEGHSLRLEISSSNFPQYDRNLNTGEDHTYATDSVIARQRIFHTREYPSRLVLPVIPARAL